MGKRVKEPAFNLPVLYEGKLIGLPQPKTSYNNLRSGDASPGENVELNRFKDIYRSSADETNLHGKIINLDNKGAKEDFKSEDHQDPWQEGEGYYGHVYRRRLNGPKEDSSIPFAKLTDDVKEYAALYDEDEKYEFLVPYIDPETGKPILAKTTDTYKGLKERGYTPYNKFGVAKDDASVWEDLSSSALNFAGDIPDHLLGATRYLYEGLNLATPDAVKFNDPVYQFLEKAGEVHEREKLMNEFLPSKASQDPFTGNWWATGTASAILSTAEFGAIGRGLGATVKGFNAIAGAFGREGLKQAAIGTVSRYGASGIMGFGYGFNEASAAGLSEGERFGYATLVGAITSGIELYGGKQFDEFLVGGGVQAAAKELIKDKALEMPAQSLQKYVAKKIVELPGKVISKAKIGLPEAAEEAAQSTVEQGFKLAFNYVWKNDPTIPKGEGRFDIDEFSFAEIGSSALFGFLAPMPFRGTSPYASAFQEVANGNESKIRQNLSNNVTQGKISQKQYQQANITLDKIAEQAADYEKIYGRFTGDDRNFILKALAGPVQAKALYAREIEKKIAELGDVDLEDAMAKSSDVKKFVEDRRKKIEEINAEIKKFEDPNHTDNILAQYKDQKRKMWEARNNAFDQMAALAEYKEQTNEADLIAQIQSQPAEHYKEKSAVRTAGEASIAMNAIRENRLAPEYHGAVISDVVRKGLLFSDQVNTPENQQLFAMAFADQGDESNLSGLKKLPLNAQEREKISKGEAVPFIEERLMNPEFVRDVLNSEENLNDAVEQVVKQRFGENFAGVHEDHKAAVRAKIREELAADQAREKFFRISSFLQGSKSASMGALAGLDQTEDVYSLLSPEQISAFQKILTLKGVRPAIMLSQGKGRKFYGIYDQGKNFAAITGDFERISELISLQKPTAQDKKELAELRSDLFHKLVHELGGHHYLDKALTNLWTAYMDAQKGERSRELEAQYFQRMVRLAELSYHAMSRNPNANGLYFMAIAKNYMAELDLGRKAQMSLTLVKEFMAESLSNGSMQAIMSSYDLNDPKNADLVQSIYGYKTTPKTKNTLWTELVNAVSSIFTFFKDVFTKAERTLLTEAIHLGSGADFDQYAIGATKRSLKQSDLTELTISAFDGVNLFEGESGVTPEMISSSILSKLSERGINFTPGREFTKKIEAYLHSIVKGEGEVIVEDSLAVLFFQKTDTFMITWQYEDSDGKKSRQRSFFNAYGEQVFVNTNPKNTTAPLTIQKHLFKAFELSDTDPNKASQIELVNNVRRAAKENFYGRVHFELDENHTYKLGNKTVTSGQIKAIYTFKDSDEQVVIGYTHDLSKVRLARLLKRGVKLSGYVTPENETGSLSEEGSTAYMKLDENDNIIDMMQLNNDRYQAMSIEERNQYTRGATFNPALNFYFQDDIQISDEVQEEADRIDSITTQDENVEPSLDVKDISGYERILREGVTNDFYKENLFLSFYSPSQWDLESGSREQIANFYQTSILRTGMINALALKAFGEGPVAVLVNNLVEAVQARMDQKGLNMPHLGFESTDELVSFKEYAVAKIYERFGNEDDTVARDSQDWSDRGSNPSGKISEAIKAAFESEAYTWDGAQYFVDWSEAEDVMFAASRGARSFEDIVANVQRAIDEGDYIGRQAEVAKSVLNHLTRDRSAQLPQQRFFEGARKSYWSQFSSVKRMDAVIQSTRHLEDPDGLGAHMRYASEYQMIREKEGEIVGKLQKKFSEIQAKAKESGRNTKDILNEELDAFYREKLGDSFTDGLLKTKSGSQSTLRNLIAPIKTAFTPKKLNTVSTAIKSFITGSTKNPYEVIDGVVMFSEEYMRAVEKLTVALEYFDIQIPPSLLSIRENPETKAKIQEMLDYNASAAEIREAVSTMALNNVNMVAFELSDPATRKKKYDRYPMISLVASMLDWNLKDIIDNKARPFEEKTNMELAKQLLKHEGNNRTPKFYLNTTFEKEYAYKTKNNTDELFERLQLKNSDTLKKYRASKKYRYNTVLDAIEESNGEPIEAMMVGLNSFHESNNNITFESAGDLDFLYMHLTGFAAPANAGNNGNYYYHVDDVPSDKPKNYLYRLIRIDPVAFKSEIGKIIELENERLAKGEEKFSQAFNEDGSIKSQKVFDSLVPEVHYKSTGDGKFERGWMFDKANWFYEGRDADQIMRKIAEEAQNSYIKWTSQGLQVPLSPRYVKDLKKQQFTPEALKEKLDAERERVYKEWYFNHIINRYHLSALTMGDYIFYKPKDFIDLNKRMAGTRAPFSRALFNRAKIDMVIINDVGVTDDLAEETSLVSVPKLGVKPGLITPGANPAEITEQYEVIGETPIASKRTDAQGYITEDFAAEIKEAYGSLAGYEKIFKPVMFGVSEDKLDDAQPLYVKLSLAVMPNPDLPENRDYFRQYPNQESFARKLYSSKAQFAVFASGIKVGANTLNNYQDESYKTTSFDSNLFGMQNNPFHDPNSNENFLNGLLQITKQLGDNHPENKAEMERYHTIEAALIKYEIGRFFAEEMKDVAGIRDLIKENLGDEEFTKAIKDFMTGDVNVLDSPVLAKYGENILNAMVKARTRLYKKPGEKLVNISDLGFSRPELSESDKDYRFELLENVFDMPAHLIQPYNGDLQWLGPRRVQDLTIHQLKKAVRDKMENKISIDENGYILDKDGSIKIFPADILVPPSPHYEIGSRTIGIRIPTSKKGSAVPGEVVGFLSDKQGNGIVYGKHGTGVLGFDFDVDGMFTWRETVGDSNYYDKYIQEMFDIAYGVLTAARNYNEMTSPVSTDLLSAVANDIESMSRGNKSEAVYTVKQVEIVPGDPTMQEQIVNDQDIAAFRKKVESGNFPLEYYTYNTLYGAFYNPLTSKREKAPGSAVWRLDPETKLYNMIDVETGETYYENVDMMTGLQSKVEVFYGGEVTVSPTYKFSKFSPDRQIAAKKSNGDGKDLIGMFASYSGIHSLFAQYGVAFSGKNYYYNYEGQQLRSHEQYTLKDELITDIFSELINAATDNAKLQLLSRLGINKITAPVLSDMVAHAIPLDYAIWFINQPAIKEYMRINENQSAASFKGDKIERIFESVEHALISSARKIDEKFQFKNPIFVNKVIVNEKAEKIDSKNFEEVREKGKIFKAVRTGEDAVFIPEDDLKNSLHRSFSELTIDQINTQLIALNKFRLYKERLSKTTAKVGKIVQLTSSFPKTFIELNDTMKKIETSLENPNIDVSGIYEHPYYSMMRQTVKNLMDRYSEFKLYARKDVMDYHRKVTLGVSLEGQQKLVDDFYSYILTGQKESDNKAGKFNLTTSSLTGSDINPWDFVHESAQVVKQLKKEFPDNEFLKLLKIVPGPKNIADVFERRTDPDYISSMLNYELDAKQLSDVRKGFNNLPENFTYEYRDIELNKTVPVTISSVKDMILGHLLHTKGMTLGGFSFSKILPADVVRSFDKAVKDVIITPEMIEEFFYQSSFNIGEMVKEVTNEDISVLTSNSSPVEILYDGAGEEMTLRFMIKGADPASIEKQKLMKVIKRKGKDGRYRFFEAAKIVGPNLNVYEYKLIEYNPSRAIKFYDIANNPTQMKSFNESIDKTNAVDIEIAEAVKNLEQFDEEQEAESFNWNKIMPTQKVDPSELQARDFVSVSGLPMKTFDTVNIDLVATEIDGKVTDADLIRSGKKTAMSSSMTAGNVLAKIKKDDLFRIKIGDEFLLVRAVKDSYALKDVMESMKSRSNAEKLLVSTWAGYQGIDPANVTLDTVLGLRQVQFQYVATTDASGKITHESDVMTNFEVAERARRKREEAVKAGLSPEEVEQYIKC